MKDWNWLSPSCIIAYGVIALCIYWGTSDAAELEEHKRNLIVYDVLMHEPAMRVVTQEGKEFTCLITGEGYGFTGESEKYVAFTCIPVGVSPATWQFCRGKNGTPIFECIPSGTKIRGGEPNPGFEPKIQMRIEKL